MATVFLNGVLASTALDANVAGGTTPDQIVSTGALDGGRIKGAQNNDTLAFDLSGSNIANSVINGNDGDDSLLFFNSFPAVRSSITDTNIFGGKDIAGDSLRFGGVLIGDVLVGEGTKVRANDGNDGIYVQSADGALFNGNSGNDVIEIAGAVSTLGGFMNSEVFGGQGNDTVRISGAETSAIKGNIGDDSIDFQGGALTVAAGLLVNGNDGDDTITADSASGSISDSVLRGGAGADIIDLSNGAGTTFGVLSSGVDLFGDAGDDTIVGGAGADDIIGGTGADDLSGGRANGAFTPDGEADNFIFEVGDSLAATAKTTDVLTYGNGVDVVFNLEEAFDTVTYKGVTYDFADLTGGVIGTATIDATGDFLITSNGTAAGLYAVQGNWTQTGALSVIGTFDDIAPLSSDYLLFDAGSALAVNATVIGTSVEAVVFDDTI